MSEEQNKTEKQAKELEVTLSVAAQRMKNRAKREGRKTQNTPQLDKFMEERRKAAGSPPKEERG